MTDEDEENFDKATFCHICKKRYRDDENGVRDHCHITGKYRGSAHNVCNLAYKISAHSLKIPVVFHNLRGYDGHLIIKEMGDVLKIENEKIRLKNIEIEEKNKKIDEENDILYKKNAYYSSKHPEHFEVKKKRINKKQDLTINIIPCSDEKYVIFNRKTIIFY